MVSKNIGTSGAQSTSIMARLKKETKDYHSRLESLSFFKALIDHNLPLACYLNQLRALAVIHAVLENEIATSEDERILPIWHDGMKKLPLLEQDIRFFETRVLTDYKPSIEAALNMTDKIRLRRIENPVTLLGYLYVFEGSTLGNRMHQPDISTTFHLDQIEGCRYYASYQNEVPSHWKRFCENMNRALEDASLHDQIIESAHEAFSGLEVIYRCLYPMDEDKKTYHVSRINPEAGNHPIPQDVREIQAALKASDRAWAEFPYYEQRYGVRGKRFSDSDTCWLVTLTQLDQESLQKQVEWIGRVLATRGMPSFMLECTLFFLHEALLETVPNNTAIYDKLQKSASALKDARIRAIPEKEWDALSREFDQTVGSPFAENNRNTGKLVLSAVADQKNGIKGSLEALQQWLTDAARFPEKWIKTVNTTIEKAMLITT